MRSRPPVAMLTACVCFSVMASLVYTVGRYEPQASPLVASLVRSIVNLVMVLVLVAATGDLRDVWGDKRSSLWLRGLFGAVALMLLFVAIQTIGMGEASFLSSSSGIFIAALSPFVLGQRSSLIVWLAILGGIVGLYFLFEPRLHDVAPWGRSIAVMSGFLVALSYLLVAKAGQTNAASTVIFYFCFISLALHGVIVSLFPITWPATATAWSLLFAAGVFGSIGQYFVTVAYQWTPAALNAAVSYLIPVMNLLIGVVVFRIYPDTRGWIGAGIVLFCGVCLPFLRK